MYQQTKQGRVSLIQNKGAYSTLTLNGSGEIEIYPTAFNLEELQEKEIEVNQDL